LFDPSLCDPWLSSLPLLQSSPVLLLSAPAVEASAVLLLLSSKPPVDAAPVLETSQTSHA